MNKLPSSIVMDYEMDCIKARKWIHRQLDGDEIPKEVQKALEQHLATCKRCEKWATQMKTAVDWVASLPQPQPSLHFKAQLYRVLGLTKTPVWIKWAASLALGFSGLWIVTAVFVGSMLFPAAQGGISWLPRVIRLARQVLSLSPDVSDFLAGAIEVAIIIFGAALVLLVLTVIASRMLKRTKSLATKTT